MRNKKCGTYAGVAEHNRFGTPVCDDCRKARNEYQRQHRADNPGKYQVEKWKVSAQSRALWLLSKRHPDEFHALVADELKATPATQKQETK